MKRPATRKAGGSRSLGLGLAACLLTLGLAASPAAATPVGTLDSSCSPTGAGGFVPFWLGSSSAQTFTAGNSGKVRYVDLGGVSRQAGGTGAPIDVELLGVGGSGTPVTPALATATIPGAGIPADGSVHDQSATFEGATAHHVDAGTTYAIALRTADTAQNVWIVRGDTCPGKMLQSGGPGSPFGTPFFTSGEDVGLDVYLGPLNDDFVRAEVLNGSTVSVNGSIRGATGQSGDSFSTEDQVSTGRSVWYRWTAPGSGPTTVDTCTTDYDSLLAVFKGSGLGSLTPVVTNNNACPSGFGSKVSFDATRGTTYRIDVDGCCGAPEGTFTLALEGPAPPPPPSPKPKPPSGDDTTAPETTIDGGPKPKLKKKRARFGFSSSEPGSSFECSVDGRPFTSCTSPHRVKAKKKGKHDFEVRAIDEAGNVDPTPALRTWKRKRKR